MKAKTRLIISIIMSLIGMTMVCTSGALIGDSSIREAPTIAALVIILGFCFFWGGLIVVVITLLFGGEDE